MAQRLPETRAQWRSLPRFGTGKLTHLAFACPELIGNPNDPDPCCPQVICRDATVTTDFPKCPRHGRRMDVIGHISEVNGRYRGRPGM